MAGDWREYRIGEIADIVGGSTPSTADPSNFNGDIPWLTPKDLSGPHDRYVSRGERNLSRKGLESCSAQLLPAGTVLVTSRAPIGYAAIAKNPIATNQGFRNLIPKPGFDSEFLYYWVKAHVEELQRHASGSTFQELTGTALAQIRIRVPPLPEQRAIAHILGTLDDKIELNRRMSETLEAMARALFKAWFVDFLPVRAKMEGRWQRGQSLPGLPAHLYDLFPDRLVDSELGEIPEGWRVVRLGDLISFEKGRKPPVSYPLPCKGCLPVVLIENFNGIVSSYALPKGMTIAQEKDVLMVMDGASSGRVETGHYGIVGSTLAKITLREGSGVGTNFLYYALKLLEPEIREHLTGTSIPHADKNWISAQMVCFPNKGELLFYFEKIVGQIRERIRALRGESRTLAALRDALLPKLIRGEIRVKDAERFLREKVA